MSSQDLNMFQAGKVDKNLVMRTVALINDPMVKDHVKEVVADSNESSSANDVTNASVEVVAKSFDANLIEKGSCLNELGNEKIEFWADEAKKEGKWKLVSHATNKGRRQEYTTL